MRDVIYNAFYRILRPLIRTLIHKGVAYGDFVQLVKHVYVNESELSLKLTEGKATTSRIAIITGLTRKEVATQRKKPISELEHTGKYNRAVNVISGWVTDAEFINSRRKPRVLRIHGERQSFEVLVNRYSGDMPVKAMLDELERLNAVELTASGGIRLITHAYVANEDEDEGLSILGTDTALLIDTISHNINPDNKNKYFQRKVSYNNLPVEVIPEFNDFVHDNAQKLLEQFNSWLSKRDRDTNENSVGSGRVKAGVGIYYFEESVENQDQSS